MKYVTWSTLGRAGAIAVLVGAVVGGIVVASASEPASASTTTPRCYSQNLKATYQSTEGAAGNVYVNFRLTNTGSATCNLHGYVGALLFNDAGSPLATTVTHDVRSAPTIALTAGGSTHFYLHYPNPAVLNCTPTTSHNLLITAPGATNPDLAHVSAGISPCHGAMTTGPVGTP